MNIYADNAATTAMLPEVIDAMLKAMNQNYGNASSLHSIGQEAKVILEDCRQRIAKVLGCKATEITFTSGGSEADNQAIISAAKNGAKKGKKHIISSKFEHHAVLHTLNKLQEEGFEIELLEVPSDGVILPEEVEASLRPDTCLVTIMYANNEIGTIQPISEIGRICKEKGVVFHTDAVQAVGHLDIDVNKENIDMLSLSAHKFHGPKGIGLLYARQGIRLWNVIEGGAQERGKRAGTENIPAIVGMTVALELAMSNLSEKTNRLLQLKRRLIQGLKEIPYAEINGDETRRLPGNVNFCFEGIEGESLLLLLDDKGIAASSGSACTSGSLEPSHVLLAIGRPHEVAHGSLRLSILETNTEEEMDYIVESVKEVVERLRNMSPFWRDLCNGTRKHIFKEWSE